MICDRRSPTYFNGTLERFDTGLHIATFREGAGHPPL